MGRIAAIGGLCNLGQVHGVGTIVHDAVVQVGASGIRAGPTNDRHALIHALEFRTRRDLYDIRCGRVASEVICKDTNTPS